MTAQIALLADGRLHLQHGPIDLVCRAWGSADAVRTAYGAAASCFPRILPALCEELCHLRTGLPTPRPNHPVAQAMHAACTRLEPSWEGSFTRHGVGGWKASHRGGWKASHRGGWKASHRGGWEASHRDGWDKRGHEALFLTPMAAVAGSVADHVLAAMDCAAPLQKAYVNNGGDIAFHLTPGATLRCGVVTTLATPTLDARLVLTSENPSRGIATSGRACKGQGGRSFSLGIADAVTVLADTAAMADAAATIVGNAVNVDHPDIRRRPAQEIDPDSDLGARLVAWSVPPLEPAYVRQALDAGLRTADSLRGRGLIHGAFLALQGQFASQQPEVRAA